jgi:xylulokinase
LTLNFPKPFKRALRARGAAILAGIGAGGWASVDEACDKVVRVAARIAQHPSDSKIMQQAYRTYRKIYPALHHVFD